MVALTTVAVPLIYKPGTRALYITAMCGMNVTGVSSFNRWVLVAANTLFCVAFVLGHGPIPWMVTGEIFSQADKATAMTSNIFVSWLVSFSSSSSFHTPRTPTRRWSSCPKPRSYFLPC